MKRWKIAHKKKVEECQVMCFLVSLTCPMMIKIPLLVLLMFHLWIISQKNVPYSLVSSSKTLWLSQKPTWKSIDKLRNFFLFLQFIELPAFIIGVQSCFCHEMHFPIYTSCSNEFLSRSLSLTRSSLIGAKLSGVGIGNMLCIHVPIIFPQRHISLNVPASALSSDRAWQLIKKLN